MPIVSHTVETSIQANGGSHNVLRMYDQDGKGYMLNFYISSGGDVNSFVTNQLAAMDVQLAEQEFQTIVEVI